MSPVKMDQIDAIVDVCLEGRLDATQNDPGFENFNGILIVDKIIPTEKYGHKISFGTSSGRSSGDLEDRYD